MEDLIKAAQEARAKAYAPYSRFSVGAALRDDQGVIHAGCNVENAAYPMGWCAEASAIAAMVMAGGRRIEEVAIIGTGAGACTPCGGCRQKLREFADSDLVVHLADDQGLRESVTLGELLPRAFGPESLP